MKELFKTKIVDSHIISKQGVGFQRCSQKYKTFFIIASVFIGKLIYGVFLNDTKVHTILQKGAILVFINTNGQLIANATALNL